MTNIFYSLLLTINIMCIGLLAGGLMVFTIANVPMFIELSGSEFAKVHRIIDRYIHPYMPILSGTTLLTAIILLWLSQSIWQSISIVLGIFGVIAVVCISEFINVPLNKKIYGWSLEICSEEDINTLRVEWIRAHFLRSFASVIGFIFFILPPFFIIH